MHIINDKKETCTGCAACVNICEHGAIRMMENVDGFLYPIVDIKKCVDCGHCVTICEMRDNVIDLSSHILSVYAMQSKDDYIRLHSTSGGIFSLLAGSILEKSGGVVGAAYQEDWSVKHRVIWNLEDLEDIRRSKYQQSEIGYLYREIGAALQEKKKILFCGTPCQVGGLKAFLGKEYENLYTCDFICRGVSSPKIFLKYIADLKQCYKSDIEFIWMKNKCNGWHSLTTVIGFRNGTQYEKKGGDDSYIQLYLKYNAGVRDSCYECRFKGNRSMADITLGDFWGLEENELDDNCGTSVVICRSKKGEELIDTIECGVLSQKMSLERVKKGNPCLDKSLGKPKINMEEFYKILENEGYGKAVDWVKKYAKK